MLSNEDFQALYDTLTQSQRQGILAHGKLRRDVEFKEAAEGYFGRELNSGEVKRAYNYCKARAEGSSHIHDSHEENPTQIEQNYTANEATISTNEQRRIKTVDDLLEVTGVDLDVWHHPKSKLNTWEQNSKKDGLVTLFQVSAELIRKEAQLTEIPPLRPVKLDFNPPKPNPPKKSSEHVALILMDRQYGFQRVERTGELIPMHDRKAIDVAVQLAKDLQPDVIVDVGDLLDVAEWSTKFSRSPELERTTQGAICEAAHDNGRLRHFCPDARMIFIPGNHDKRIQEYLIENKKAAAGLKSAKAVKLGEGAALSIAELTNMRDMHIEVMDEYPDGFFYLNEGLRVIHGEMAKSHSGHTVMTMLKDLMVSTIFGHIHRIEMATRTRWHRGEARRIVAASGGCLCKIDGVVPGVRKKQNWQQGLLVVTYDPDGLWHQVEPVPIHDGKAHFRGQWYEGTFDVHALSEETGWDFEPGFSVAA